MSVQLILDSTVDLMPAEKEACRVIPLTVTFGEQEYLDGVTISHRGFYEKLVEGDVLPTTSQASPASFEEVYNQVTADGDEAVVLTVSSKLSGTYQSACIAAEERDNIFVVDSASVAIGAGILAEFALLLREQGQSAKEIARRLEEKKKDVRVIALLDTLEYLKKGGRISSAVAFAGGILNIKPVVDIQDGAIRLLGKARGSKQGNNLLVQEIEKSGGIDFSLPILLGYTGLTDVLLKKYIEDSAALWQNSVENVNHTSIGSAVGTHAGPGAVAAAFFCQAARQ